MRVRSPFLELQSGLILSRMAKLRRLGGDVPQIAQKMGVSVCGGSATWRNFEDHGSAEHKLRLFRASLCYLGCSFHSLCPTHHIRSIRGFALLKRPPLATRKFLFIDIQQVAMYPQPNKPFRICACSAKHLFLL